MRIQHEPPPDNYDPPPSPAATWRPGPQPENQIAAGFAAQLRRAFRRPRLPDDAPITSGAVRRMLRRRDRQIRAVFAEVFARLAALEGGR